MVSLFERCGFKYIEIFLTEHLKVAVSMPFLQNRCFLLRTFQYYYIRYQRVFNRHGTSGVCRAIKRKLWHISYKSNDAVWYCRDIIDDSKAFQLPNGYEVNFSETSKTIKYLKENNASYPFMYISKEINAALKNNHIYPALKKDNRIIGYIKLGLGTCWVVDFEKNIHLPQGYAFIYDSFVEPDFRGRGIGTAFIYQTVLFLREKEYHKIWCHVPLWNIESQKAYAKVAFVEESRVKYLRFFFLRSFFGLTAELKKFVK